MTSEQDWKGLALKGVAGLAAVAVAGYLCWVLSKEDELEKI